MSAGVLQSPYLAPVRRGVHSVRDYLHYRPALGFQARALVRGALSSTAVVDTLRARGICILERFLDADALRTYQEALQRLFVQEPVSASADPKNRRDYSNIDFARYPIFAELILNEFVLAVIEAYYARPICLALSQVQRLEPSTPYEEGSFRWHHDTKGKYVKTMWLLTDVPPQGQRMSYVAGSHRLRHRWTTYEETRFADADIRSYGTDVVECAGPAGTVIIFDTNGIHRGNRNLGPRREVAFGVYSAGRYLEGCRFDPERVSRLPEWQQDIVKRSKPRWHPCPS